MQPRGQCLAITLLLLLTTGCSERVIEKMDCEVANPLPLLELGPHEYVASSLIRRLEGGWLLTVERYEEDIFTVASYPDHEITPLRPIEARTLWVDPCGGSLVFPEEVQEWTTVRPGGPWVAQTASTAYLVRELSEPLTWEPLAKGDALVGVYEGDLLLLDDEATLYRWDPDQAPSQRKALADDVAIVLAPPGPRSLVIIDLQERLWEIDPDTGAAEWLADDVARVRALTERFLLLEEDIEQEEGGVRLFDRTSGDETVLPEGAPGGWIPSEADEGWLVLLEGDSMSGFETSFVHLPDGEVLRREGRFVLNAFVSEREADPYLSEYEAVLWHFDRKTGAMTLIADFGGVQNLLWGSLHVVGEWIYVAHLNPYYPGLMDIYRTPRDNPGTEFALVVERSSTLPGFLPDGRLDVLQSSDFDAPGNLVLVDPETRATTTLARNVPRDYISYSDGINAISDAEGPPGFVDLVYMTVHAGQGGTLWNYRVPEP